MSAILTAKGLAAGHADRTLFSGLDLVVAQFVWADKGRFLLYCFMGALGSALGSLVVYGIGYKGGEELLVKRIGQARFDRIHARFEKSEFLTLALPAMAPMWLKSHNLDLLINEC